MSQEEMFKYYFLYRRVKNCRLLFRDGRVEVRVSDNGTSIYLYLWGNEPAQRNALHVGYSYPDGRVWIAWHVLESKLNWRKAQKIRRWLLNYCTLVVENDREQVWRIKPCAIKSVVGSVGSNTAFGDRLVSRYGVEQ